MLCGDQQATMRKKTLRKNGQAIATLDTLWKRVHDDNEDVTKADTEDLTEEKSKDCNTKMTKTTKTSNDNMKSTDEMEPEMPTTVALFPFAARFKIAAENSNDAHQKHVQVLKEIAKTMEHCEIYSDENNKINIDDTVESNFNYHELGKSRKHYIVIHRMTLNEKYHLLKGHDNILKALQEKNCYLQNHTWTRKQWDIVSAGFISGASPKHQAKDTICNKLDLLKTPDVKYQLHATKIKANDGTSTLAYEVQCNRSGLNEVINHVAEACKHNDQTFIKYQWKYTHPTVFSNGVKKQNAFTNDIHTIPIYGITPDAMSYMFHPLINRCDILDVGMSPKTPTMGRWNVYTTCRSFETTTKWLQDNLNRMYHKDCKHDRNEVPANYKPEVKFNTIVVFTPAKHDHLIKEAEKSLRPYSRKSVASPSNATWASIVRN